ncbi:MAG: glycosyltransferase [Lactobacillus sp.]|jgi:hyaluronan synthase|uniref:glycosyltransferase n=1 Tax=uncultured Lactobacillus sp. TaxID=153152 RepID=UPI002666DA54|nr:glycosyltransferase [uncultured Lactobacillus sp.]
MTGKEFKVNGEVLLDEKKDRRLLPNVPDPSHQRSKMDRRGDITADENLSSVMSDYRLGIRYVSDFKVKLRARHHAHPVKAAGTCADISDTGMLIKFKDQDDYEKFKDAEKLRLKFKVPAGAMPEGHEMRFRTSAKLIRCDDAQQAIGVQFSANLASYMKRHKDRFILVGASWCLALVAFCVVLMRAESVIYYKYNAILYTYSLIAAAFLLTRYLFGALYKPVPVNPDFTPSVTIIIPCFNEETWIQTTILSCLDQYYPVDKLKVIVVDDCSTDRSVEKIEELYQKLLKSEDERYRIKDRFKYFVQEKNAGKRDALVRGVENTDTDLVMFVDSDSFLEPDAVVNLVQPFQDPKMGGCAGRCDVANTYTNALTEMQSVRYYIAFRIMKAAEGIFDAVTCLSGPLSCYRRDLVLKYKDDWINQRFLGHKATFGDDRSMTNFILRHNRCGYQDTAVCSTIVPRKHKVFLKQQMRWKRSWLRESLRAGLFMWRKEPYAAINFYIGLIVPMLAPVVVVYNLMWVPLTQHIFPTTFLVGLMLMSLMMTFAQLLLRKSSTWAFGFLFCLYYEVVLLWQMPIAWFTFWKSTWGTRMTPSDVKEKAKKEAKKEAKAGKISMKGGESNG